MKKVISLIIVLSVVLLVGCGRGGNTAGDAPKRSGKLVTVEKEASQWSVRLVARDERGLQSADAQLGAVEEGDAEQRHTLKALSPFGGSYLDIVFVDPDGVEPGEYKSSFHESVPGQTDEWTFTVRADADYSGKVSLSWRGLYVLESYTDETGRIRYREHRSLTNPLLKKMRVVDMKSGETVPVITKGKMNSITFAMTGSHSRTFRWELLTEENMATEAAVSEEKGTSSLWKRVERIRQEKKVKFDLSKPPTIKGNQDGT
ncbi:hypothetical protein [Nitratifractor salsuginis]|uniref:Lipoprotein n=1 Tax=Nitratifractor salsuginis (strain DSM 16511 / JCM 12458 / E9I37-1) TaxID=749222 RepID=E6X192_NITSE|nr:hypothetical protein [Nitratifractor salsuginis]ADV46954.1 hypothetical protein Nitsa_1708 [Nitratifractor salsuginis DSM 16511]